MAAAVFAAIAPAQKVLFSKHNIPFVGGVIVAGQ